MKTARDPMQARLRALADPSRFRILSLLRGGPRCVGEVADAVGLSQSCTTRHLQVLARTGLVARTPQGRQVQVALSASAHGLLEALAGAAAGPAAAPARRAVTRAEEAPADTRSPRKPPRPRATPPSSDIPPAPAPEPTAAPRRLPIRSTLEDYLL